MTRSLRQILIKLASLVLLSEPKDSSAAGASTGRSRSFYHSRRRFTLPCALDWNSLRFAALSAIASIAFTLAASAATESIIHNFNRTPGGANPNAGLIADVAGNLYGVTPKGGAYGVVFRLSKNAQGHWTEIVLHNFMGGTKVPDGAFPQASLLLDTSGNLYGTTQA